MLALGGSYSSCKHCDSRISRRGFVATRKYRPRGLRPHHLAFICAPPLHSGMDCVQEGITPTSPCSHPRVICGAPPSLKDGLSSAGPPLHRDGLRPGRDYAHTTLQSSAPPPFTQGWITSREGLRPHHLAIIRGSSAGPPLRSRMDYHLRAPPIHRDGPRPGRDYAHITLHSSAGPPLHAGMDYVQEGITPTSPCNHLLWSILA